jgi:hypothetical protein
MRMKPLIRIHTDCEFVGRVPIPKDTIARNPTVSCSHEAKTKNDETNPNRGKYHVQLCVTAKKAKRPENEIKHPEGANPDRGKRHERRSHTRIFWGTKQKGQNHVLSPKKSH